MAHDIDSLLAGNRRFVAEQLARDAAAFDKLAEGQHPQFLWIGCSDSRVAPDLVTGTGPGEMFVHRNIANLVVQTDMNLLSVLQYAVEVLRVQHVIVCGHHGCGGVQAAMRGPSHGLIDNWLRTVRDTQQFFWPQLAPLDEGARLRRLVELNVIEQVYNLGKTSIVQQAWRERGRPFIHGWVFDVGTGGIEPLTGMLASDAEMQAVCKFHQAPGVRTAFDAEPAAPGASAPGPVVGAR
jgi:carbonic anhydrase